MAYVTNEQDPNQQQAQAGAAVPTTSSAPGSGPGTQTKGGTPQSTPSQPFQNLQAYLTANQPQVSAQADKISGNLNNQYGSVKNDINAAQGDFENQVQSGYAKPNDQVVNQAASNPTSFANDPNNVKAFQSLYNDTYSGPSNGFETTGTYSDLNAKANKATSDANLVKTVPGLQTYFQGQNPNATKGGNILDATLLSGSPEAYKNVVGAANKFSDLPTYLNAAATTENQNVTNAQQQAAQIAQDTQNKFTGTGGVIPTAQTDLANRVTQAQQGETDSAARVKDAFDKIAARGQQVLGDVGKPSSQWSKDSTDWNSIFNNLDTNKDLANMGLDANQLNTIFGNTISANRAGASYDPRNYLSQQVPGALINSSNTATKEDYDTAAALSKLTGQDLTSYLNPGNANQAGTAPKSVSNFDYNGAYNRAIDLMNAKNPTTPLPHI